MQKLVLLLITLAVANFAIAQEAVLPKDESGKFIYYEVAKAQSSLSVLQERTKTYFRLVKSPILKSVAGDTSFVAHGKIIINKTVLEMGHPSGEVLYQLNVALKDGKYRFWLTDFMFIPYQRDRYGNFVPSTTVGKSLEDEPKKLNAQQWKAYQLQTAQYCKTFAEDFKRALADAMPKPKQLQPQSVKKDW